MALASIAIHARSAWRLQVTKVSYSCDIFASGAVSSETIASTRAVAATVRKKLARQIARAKNKPARDAIEFGQRQRSSELIARRDQH